MKVTTTQQSPHSEPVEIVWSKDTDEVGVMLCVAQLLRHAKDEAPWAPRVLDIRIEL